MHICIFNPEHDLCLAKGRAHYVPPRSAVEFALHDADIMLTLYPDAACFSVYDERLRPLLPQASLITAWGWNAVVKWELLKRGAPMELLPTDEQLDTIRRLQHRQTVMPLQSDVRPASNEADVRLLMHAYDHVVLKSPWSGAGRGIRWVHHEMTDIDKHWFCKMVRDQGCVMVEPRRDVVLDIALEYQLEKGDVHFAGYSLFRTGSGVYKDNFMLDDDEIESRIRRLTWPQTQLLYEKRSDVEQWLTAEVAPYYSGPLGVDLMVCKDKHIYIAEMNLRHTMGMIAHARMAST